MATETLTTYTFTPANRGVFSASGKRSKGKSRGKGKNKSVSSKK